MLELAAGYYALINAVTLAAFFVDKRRAIANGRAGANGGRGGPVGRGGAKRRIPERRLHALALAGGFAGTLAGMLLLRHKRRHAWFAVIALGATLAHAAAWWVIMRA